MRRDLAIALATLLMVTLLIVLARTSNAAPPEIAPLTATGPDGSTFTLTASNRLRGEFVDWFDNGPPADNSDYSYLGNRTQIGFGAKWRGLSGFLQYQHTVLEGVPENGAGVGGTYRLNTNSGFQEQGWLRQGWLQGEVTRDDWRLSLQGGRFRYLDGQEADLEAPEPRVDPQEPHLRAPHRTVRLHARRPELRRRARGARRQGAESHRLLSDSDLGRIRDQRRPSHGHRSRRPVGHDEGPPSACPTPRRDCSGSTTTIGRPGDGDVVVLDNRPAPARQADHDDLTLETIGADFVHVACPRPRPDRYHAVDRRPGRRLAVARPPELGVRPRGRLSTTGRSGKAVAPCRRLPQLGRRRSRRRRSRHVLSAPSDVAHLRLHARSTIS